MANEEKKLSYEELEAYAQQLTAKAKSVFEENQKLKQAIEEMTRHFNVEELNLVFKVLDHKDCFSKRFVNKVVKKLEEVLEPENKEDNKDQEEEK